MTIPKITDFRKRQASDAARQARQSFSKGSSKFKIPRKITLHAKVQFFNLSLRILRPTEAKMIKNE